jgi:hypothetical protein
MLEQTTSTDACAHHWMLSSPAGDSTDGVCKLCGATRRFNDAYQAPIRNLHNVKPKQ